MFKDKNSRGLTLATYAMILAGVGAFGIAGCEQDGAVEDAGEAIDEAGEDTADAIDDAANELD